MLLDTVIFCIYLCNFYLQRFTVHIHKFCSCIAYCIYGFTVLDCNRLQHLQKVHYLRYAGGDEKSFGLSRTMRQMLFSHKIFPCENIHCMMDACYLLAFILLSKELSTSMPVSCCNSFSICFIPLISSSFLHIREYLQHFLPFNFNSKSKNPKQKLLW